ncbi:hypothetical protein Btru_012528 [Bulinus truncatus]|nr:hypothetical protein Btru_012528 [Bulinus truncatus]
MGGCLPYVLCWTLMGGCLSYLLCWTLVGGCLSYLLCWTLVGGCLSYLLGWTLVGGLDTGGRLFVIFVGLGTGGRLFIIFVVLDTGGRLFIIFVVLDTGGRLFIIFVVLDTGGRLFIIFVVLDTGGRLFVIFVGLDTGGRLFIIFVVLDTGGRLFIIFVVLDTGGRLFTICVVLDTGGRLFIIFVVLGTGGRLFIIFVGLDTVASYRGVSFYTVDDPNSQLWTSSGVGDIYYDTRSVKDCARRCLEQSTCSVVTYNQNNATCTLGECTLVQPVARSPSLDLYQTSPPLCGSTPGFNVETKGQTSACLWWSNTHSNFTNAVDDCKAKASILATFKTYEKFQMLKNNTEYYIGLDDMGDEGIFRWHDDGSVLDSNYSKNVFKSVQGLAFRGGSFSKVDNPNITLWSSPTTLTTYYLAESVTDCAMRCIEQNNTCGAISYEPGNSNCILGECGIVQSVARSSSVDLYNTTPPLCNSTPGFNIETNGTTLACLWWSSTHTNFTNAMGYCKAKGSVMASFKTWEKFRMLKNNTEYYIGLDDMEVEGVFRWHDDRSVLDMNSSYSKQIFKPGSTDNGKYMSKVDNSYVTLWSSSGTLFTKNQTDSLILCALACAGDGACNAVAYDNVNLTCSLGTCVITQPVIKSPSVKLYQTPQPMCNSTPGFNIETNGTTSACLWWSDDKQTLTVARDACIAKGSVLASFKTWEKFQILKQRTYEIYIGLDDMEVEGVFRWHDDGSVFDLNSLLKQQIFYDNSPDNYGGYEDCVSYIDGKLNDLYCGYQNRYVCEKTCFSF